MNGVNSNMKGPKLDVGVIVPPDSHYKPVLYSDSEAEKNFNVLCKDIFQSTKKSGKINEHKTPKSIYIFLGGILAALGVCKIKHLIKK